MLLPAHGDPAGQAVRGGGDGLGRVAARQRHRREDQFGVPACRGDVEHRGKLLILHLRQPGGAACLVAGQRGDGEQRLADVLHQIGGEQRLVGAVHGADLVDARHVVAREHRDHAGGRPHLREVHGQDARVRLGRQAQVDVQQSRRLRQVVHVGRLAGDVLVCAVVAARLVDAADDLGRGSGVRHGGASRRRRGGWATPRRSSRRTASAAGWRRWSCGTRHSPASRSAA